MDKTTGQDIPDKKRLLKTREVIQPYVHRTPVLTCSTLEQITGATLYFKCENFQKGGAFKFRGASHAVMTLPEDQLSNGWPPTLQETTPRLWPLPPKCVAYRPIS